jgi:hypothetical protein
MRIISPTLLVSLSLVVACGQSKPSENKQEQVKTEKMEITEIVFKPDSTINSQIFLHNPSSTVKVLGDIMSLIDADEALPSAYFKSQNGKEYLKVVFFPGNEANSISQFTVGHSVNLSNSEKPNPVRLITFQTESDIRLGMTKQELLSIKGSRYREEGATLTYTIDDASFPFLSKFNMPIYVAEYSFKNGKLDKFKFGFEYP